jgi:hypothetical protein
MLGSCVNVLAAWSQSSGVKTLLSSENVLANVCPPMIMTSPFGKTTLL